LNKVSVVKVTMLKLSIGVVLSSIILALNEYGWDVSPLITPSYSPPKVDFRMQTVGVKAEGKQLQAIFKLTNLGEVQLQLESLNATAYGPDGRPLAPAILAQAVILAPNSSENIALSLSLNEDPVSRLISYFEGRNSTNVEVRGEATMRVLGSLFSAPITSSFQLSIEDIEALG